MVIQITDTSEMVRLNKGMNYIIRELKPSEYKVLEDFLYEAIFIPKGADLPPREIINQPELQIYIKSLVKKMIML